MFEPECRAVCASVAWPELWIECLQSFELECMANMGTNTAWPELSFMHGWAVCMMTCLMPSFHQLSFHLLHAPCRQKSYI